MKTKRDLIKTISIVRGNLRHIESTGNINGTLLIEIERVMEEYAQQQVKNLNIPAVMQRSEQLPCDRCKKLEFMIENGLGWKDMENDCT